MVWFCFNLFVYLPVSCFGCISIWGFCLPVYLRLLFVYVCNVCLLNLITDTSVVCLFALLCLCCLIVMFDCDVSYFVDCLGFVMFVSFVLFSCLFVWLFTLLVYFVVLVGCCVSFIVCYLFNMGLIVELFTDLVVVGFVWFCWVAAVLIWLDFVG